MKTLRQVRRGSVCCAPLRTPTVHVHFFSPSRNKGATGHRLCRFCTVEISFLPFRSLKGYFCYFFLKKAYHFSHRGTLLQWEGRRCDGTQEWEGVICRWVMIWTVKICLVNLWDYESFLKIFPKASSRLLLPRGRKVIYTSYHTYLY